MDGHDLNYISSKSLTVFYTFIEWPTWGKYILMYLVYDRPLPCLWVCEQDLLRAYYDTIENALASWKYGISHLAVTLST